MTKAEFIYKAFDPELPDFPLPPHLVEEAQDYDGPMPRSLGELVDLLPLPAERARGTAAPEA